jgi:hypothetical protein
MLASDVAVHGWVAVNTPWLVHAAPVAGALVVVGIGKLLARRMARVPAAATVDLATGEQAVPPTHHR